MSKSKDDQRNKLITEEEITLDLIKANEDMYAEIYDCDVACQMGAYSIGASLSNSCTESVECET